jgi:hypothetical protein
MLWPLLPLPAGQNCGLITQKWPLKSVKKANMEETFSFPKFLSFLKDSPQRKEEIEWKREEWQVVIPGLVGWGVGCRWSIT